MIVARALAAGLAVAQVGPTPVAPPIIEIDHAIAMGRLDEARMMIDRATKAGTPGAALDRSVAELAFASGDNSDAVARYEQLLKTAPTDPLLLEHASIAATRNGDFARAHDLLDRAVAQKTASWRVWNAKGALSDHDRDWVAADSAYAHAAALAPGRAEVVNNMGWSQLLRGDWAKAISLLERATALDPSSDAIADNLAFARMGTSDDLPQRAGGESVGVWAARLNDAGVAAAMRGNNVKATAAFSRALEVSERWNTRAAANLKQLGGAE